MHRDIWRELAEERLVDARALLAAKQWSGAYYLVGYSIECALKSLIADGFTASTTPVKKFVFDIHTHSLNKLIGFAGLEPDLRSRLSSDLPFQLNWQLVKDWDETSRYAIWTDKEATDLFSAVDSANNGIFEWVKSKW